MCLKKNRLCLGYVTIFSVSLLKSQLAVIDQRAPELMEFMKNIKRDIAKVRWNTYAQM